MDEKISEVCTKQPPKFDEKGNIVVSTLKQLCVTILQKEEVIIRLAQKSSQNYPDQNSSDPSYSFDTTLDDSNDNESLSCDVFHKETPVNVEQTLYTVLSEVPDVVLFLTSTAREIITELNQKREGITLPVGTTSTTPIQSVSPLFGHQEDDFRSQSTGLPQNAETEENHFSHSTGFGVSIGGSIRFKFTEDVVSLNNQPHELKDLLCKIMCTTCEEMTVVTVKRLMEKKMILHEKRKIEEISEPLRKKRRLSKCNECCVM